jgi:hypothetical protein
MHLTAQRLSTRGAHRPTQRPKLNPSELNGGFGCGGGCTSVLRRVTTLLVAAGEFLVFAKLPTPGAGGALLLMTAGAMLVS